MKKIISSTYVFFERQNIIIIYLLYLFLILTSSIIFCLIYSSNYNITDENSNIILKNIDFGHGQLIHNFYYNGELSQKFNGIDFYLKKTLALPLLITFLSKLSLNFFFIISFKNLIIYSLYFWVCFLFYKINKNNFFIFILLLFTPLFVPYNFQVSLNFNYEDNLIAIFLPLIFLLLASKKDKISYIILSALLFLSYFCKTSMFFIVLFVPLLLIIFEKKNLIKFLPLISAIIAITVWGSYGLIKTGKFPIGSSGSTINSYVMSFSFNENFNKFYPKYSTDLIEVKTPDRMINNEWDFYDYYKEKNSIYLKNNFEQLIKDFISKLKFVFFNIHKDGSLDLNSMSEIKISNIMNKIIINFSILTFLIFIFKHSLFEKNILNNLNYRNNLYFFFLFSLSIAPHLIIWATSKHLVGITNVCIIYVILQNESKIEKFIKNLLKI